MQQYKLCLSDVRFHNFDSLIVSLEIGIHSLHISSDFMLISIYKTLLNGMSQALGNATKQKAVKVSEPERVEDTKEDRKQELQGTKEACTWPAQVFTSWDLRAERCGHRPSLPPPQLVPINNHFQMKNCFLERSLVRETNYS